MSNGEFAFYLFVESVALAVLCVIYFFNYRREPAALAAALVHALHAAFFFYLGGGAHDPIQTARYVYACALGLLVAKLVEIVLLVPRAISKNDQKNADSYSRKMD